MRIVEGSCEKLAPKSYKSKFESEVERYILKPYFVFSTLIAYYDIHHRSEFLEVLRGRGCGGVSRLQAVCCGFGRVESKIFPEFFLRLAWATSPQTVGQPPPMADTVLVHFCGLAEVVSFGLFFLLRMHNIQLAMSCFGTCA